jgi:hypothetical protein
MAWRDARRDTIRDHAGRRPLIDGLEHVVVRRGWECFCSVVMGNQLSSVSCSRRVSADWPVLSRADTVPNLRRRLEARLKAALQLADDLSAILARAHAPAACIGSADVMPTEVSRKSSRAITRLDTAKPENKTRSVTLRSHHDTAKMPKA